MWGYMLTSCMGMRTLVVTTCVQRYSKGHFTVSLFMCLNFSLNGKHISSGLGFITCLVVNNNAQCSK